MSNSSRCKKWRRLHPERYKKSVRNWRQANPEKLKTQLDNWRRKNKPIIKKQRQRYYRKNSEKVKQSARLRRSNFPEKIRQSNLKQLARRYGLKLEDFLRLRKSTPHCPICEKKFIRTPCLDHCHKTGALRGFLCFKCNTALGLLNDSVGVMQKAISYLMKPPLDKS